MCVCIQRKLFSRLTFAFQNERGKNGENERAKEKEKIHSSTVNTGITVVMQIPVFAPSIRPMTGKYYRVTITRFAHKYHFIKGDEIGAKQHRNRWWTRLRSLATAPDPRSSRQRVLGRFCIFSEEIFDWKTEEDWIADLFLRTYYLSGKLENRSRVVYCTNPRVTPSGAASV